MKESDRRYTIVLLLLGSILLVSVPTWSAFSTSPYFPLPDGAYWNYIDDNSAPSSTWVVSGVVNINGVLTKILADSDGVND